MEANTKVDKKSKKYTCKTNKRINTIINNYLVLLISDKITISRL